MFFDYAVDTSSNLVIYHFFIDGDFIKARAVGVYDPSGLFVFPIDGKNYLVEPPENILNIYHSLIMEDKRDDFIIFKIVKVFEK